MMKQLGFMLSATAAVATLVAIPAKAATLIGQTVDYCTDSVREGAVSNNPADCDASVASVAGTAVIGAGVEVALDQSGIRRLDFSSDTVDVIYDGTLSFSPDLFVVYGFTADISGVSLISANLLNVTWVYGGGALGILVGAPLEDGIVTLKFAFTDAAIPEPATWIMMIAGFGLVGASTRLRRTAAAKA